MSCLSDRRDSSIHNATRKNNVKKGLKSFFSAAPKFQKTLKRGVYLASVVCCDDRVLVTSDEVLPIVEVDESYSTASLNSDLHWAMKVACTWDDVKSLRQDMDKLPNSNAFHFRSKLLNAVHSLQSALGLQQLGRFFHTPVRDASGSVVLVTVTTVRDVKSVSTAHCKWIAYSKARKKLQTTDSFSVTELLMQNVQVRSHHTHPNHMQRDVTSYCTCTCIFVYLVAGHAPIRTSLARAARTRSVRRLPQAHQLHGTHQHYGSRRAAKLASLRQSARALSRVKVSAQMTKYMHVSSQALNTDVASGLSGSGFANSPTPTPTHSSLPPTNSDASSEKCATPASTCSKSSV